MKNKCKGKPQQATSIEEREENTNVLKLGKHTSIFSKKT